MRASVLSPPPALVIDTEDGGNISDESTPLEMDEEGSGMADSETSVKTTASGAAKRSKRKAAGRKTGAPEAKCKRRDRKEKRTESPTVISSEHEDDDESRTEVQQAPQRGRGRPATTGEHVGKWKIKKQLEAERKREEEERRREEEALTGKEWAEREVERCQCAISSRLRRRAAKMGRNEEQREEWESRERDSAELRQRVTENIEIIRIVALKSKHVKGTLQKSVKEAMAAILRAADSMTERTTSDETTVLRRENTRLTAQVEDLRKDLEELRKETSELRRGVQQQAPPQAASPDPPATERGGEARAGKRRSGDPPVSAIPGSGGGADLEKFADALMGRWVKYLDARLGAFEERLPPERSFRPPLRADRGKGRPGPREESPEEATGTERGDPPVTGEKKERTASSGRGQRANSGSRRSTNEGARDQGDTEWPPLPRRKKSGEKVTEERATPRKAAAASTQGGKGTGRGSGNPPAGKRSTTATSGNNAKRAERNTGNGGSKGTEGKKMRNPTKAAITITITEEAALGGETYAEVLQQAGAEVRISDVDMRAIRCRPAQSGGRIIEIGGDDRKEKADKLARALRERWAHRGVIVARPMRTAELRIAGLSDSVTTEELTNAVAENGGCEAEQVRVGEIKRPRDRPGTAWVRCPVAAANKLAATGRVVVGWASSSVTLLAARPLQCHRCLLKGHTRSRCTAAVDRSGLCYRCGEPGHRASACSAEARCPVCRDQGRRADHRCGGAACGATMKEERKAVAGTRATASSGGATDEAEATGRPAQEREGTPMRREDLPPLPRRGRSASGGRERKPATGEAMDTEPENAGP